MTTRQSETPATVPTVTVATTKVDAGSYFHAVHVTRDDAPTIALPIYGDRSDAERLAADIRGALADAYTAGRADTDSQTHWRHPDASAAGIDSEWNGNAYRVEILACVEANSAPEAQAIVGSLLAARGGYGHNPGPLTGPGSWAPNVKRVERYATDADGERRITGDSADIVQVYDASPIPR